jgi:DNA adenine methylase
MGQGCRRMRVTSKRISSSGIRGDDAPSVAPLLRWAGSKKRQFEEFRTLFPTSFDSYVEPFAGSAAFVFRLRPHKSKINDINSDLCDFYVWAQKEPEKLYSSFIKIRRSPSVYYEVRKKFNSLPRGFSRSVYFYFLNRNCFNGIYRTNKAGQFNVPFSNSRVSPYLGRDEFINSIEALQNCKIHNKDFEAFCRSFVSHGDFVFLDPPYYRDGSRIFNEYGASVFDSEDFCRLSGLLKHLDGIGARFLLSFPRTRESILLSKSWYSEIRYVRRTVAGNPEARRKQSEMLIFNYVK